MKSMIRGVLMKKMVFGAMAVLAMAGCAAPHVVSQIDITPMPGASVQRVLDLPNLTKKQIFDKSRQWMALTFVSSKKAIEYEDENAGKIIGNAADQIDYTTVVRSPLMGDMVFPTTYGVQYTIVEDVKDGKARVVASNFRLFNVNGTEIGPIYADGWRQMTPKLDALCKSLEKYLLSSENQNW